MRKPVLVFDFDNTVTVGDVVDEIVEKFSLNTDWRAWERAWAEGRLGAIECLSLQIGNLRVSRTELLEYLACVRIDPAFARILDWARARQIDVIVVSDSFLPLIVRILENNSISGVPVFANELEFSGEQLRAVFPFHDPAFPRSANSKAAHLAAYRGHTIIFAGDGRSDLDAALASDIVFAKDALAADLAVRSVPFKPFLTLAPILEFLETLDQEYAQSQAAQ